MLPQLVLTVAPVALRLQVATVATEELLPAELVVQARLVALVAPQVLALQVV
jgi:hypothetical protein